ncbi:TPA: HNH endonuclease [Bacillus albus]
MIFINKTYPEPEELTAEKAKEKGDYNKPSIVERVKNDFYEKCYICESKDLTSLNIEHLRPHENNPVLKLDWDNLFYACTHCNNIKNRFHTSMLDCTKEREIEKIIKITPTVLNYRAELIIEAQSQDEATLDTVALLNKVYNGTTVQKKIEASNIRKNIINEILSLINLINEYDEANSPQKKERLEEEILDILHDRSEFTSIKRWYIRNIPELVGKFLVVDEIPS